MTNTMQNQTQSYPQYDDFARQYGYVFPDAMFGLCFEYLQPGQRLLDIGIGTGLSTLPFTRAGIKVYGIDNSLEMLSMCQSKNIAVELKQVDIAVKPWPFPDSYFDHVIACGVLHFIPALETIFQEVARVVHPKGIFAFTVKSPLAVTNAEGNPSRYITEMIEGEQIYSHFSTYYEELSSSCGFEMLKRLKFLLPRGVVDQDDLYIACIAQKLSG